MTRRAVFLLSLCLLAASCGAKPETLPEAEVKPVSDGVRMDAATRTRMGVETASVAVANAAKSNGGFARVMDVAPLAAIESEIVTANAAAAASEADYRRLSALALQDNAASAKAVEAARAQAAADSARSKLAEQRIGLEWGSGLGMLSGAQRSRLLGDIAAGRAALVRLDGAGADATVLLASVKPEASGPAVPVEILGAAAAADARLQTPGLFGVVRGTSARNLPSGRLLPAELQLSTLEPGYLLPHAALVRSGHSVFVYVRTGEDEFERRDVSEGRATSDGWFTAEDFSKTEIVVAGAASLLAAEKGPAEADED